MIRARLGERRGSRRIACEQPGAGQNRIDPRDLRIKAGDRGFRVCESATQRGERDTLFRRRAAEIRAPETRRAAFAAALGVRAVSAAALGQPIMVSIWAT